LNLFFSICYLHHFSVNPSRYFFFVLPEFKGIRHNLLIEDKKIYFYVLCIWMHRATLCKSTFYFTCCHFEALSIHSEKFLVLIGQTLSVWLERCLQFGINISRYFDKSIILNPQPTMDFGSSSFGIAFSFQLTDIIIYCMQISLKFIMWNMKVCKEKKKKIMS
jgi:hypothetical protein